eukprot:TRINITY_DN426_c0_g1_i1.p1 TRINITY_DN426_c0_g1~~TRINITY_DN426_c0_g1_i1.p1  ORF type:complete len:351 (+),score=60.01 TRINITY_DN426_c0_g1_i1:195-1247(+)
MEQSIPMFQPGTFQPSPPMPRQPFQPGQPFQPFQPAQTFQPTPQPFQPAQTFQPPPQPNYNPGHTQPSGTPEFFSPVAAQMAGNMFASMGSPMISQTQQAGERWFGSLKYYFAVDNLYVWHKLKSVLLPIGKNWNRQMNANSTEFLPPNQDRNAPDLYLPLMAFVTYVLLIAFFKGTNNEFSPDVIGMTTTTAFFIIGLEALCVKAGIWLLNFPSVAFLDVLAYIGYKFIGAVLNISTGLFLGHYPFLVTYAITSLSFSVFLARTLQAALTGSSNNMGYNNGASKTQSYFLVVVAVLQFLVIYFLCYISFSSPFVQLSMGATVDTVQEIPVKEVPIKEQDFGEVQEALQA